MRARGILEAIVVIVAAVGLACLQTYPLVLNADSLGRTDLNDGKWSIWVVSWVAHALTTDPLNVFHANIFYPHGDSLAYSEANLGAGVIGIPVWLATHNPFATHNFVLFVSFVISTAGGYYLCRYLTGSRRAAAVAGVLYAYCPFVFARTAHIQLMLIGGMPFCLLAFHRLVDRTTTARAMALGAVLWFQGLACAYYGVFAGMAVGLGSIVIAIARGRWRDLRYWYGLAVAASVSIGLTLPFFLHYVALQRETGFNRSLEGAQRYSANTAAWFASGAWAHRWWLPSIGSFSDVLFPGLMTLVLGVIGAWIGWRVSKHGGTGWPDAARHFDRAVVIFYVLLGVLSFWLALGPEAWLYSLLHRVVPYFSLLRAPSRRGVVVTLCLVVLAAIAVARFVNGRKRGSLMAGLFIVLAVADLFQAPLGLREAPAVSPAYEVLARLPRGPVAEFPFWSSPAEFHGHAAYMLASTFHWQPLINGYSDHIPQDFRDASVRLKGFPDPESFAQLERFGARYVVVHPKVYDPRTRESVLNGLERYRANLAMRSQTDDVWLYEIVSWPR